MYTDKNKVAALLDRDLTDSEDALFDTIVESVDGLINDYTNRQWGEVDFTSRYYDGVRNKELFVDDFVDIEKIELIDRAGDVYQTFDEDEWELYPLNEYPKNSIYLKSYRFPLGRANIKITAKFSSGEVVPSAITLASTRLTGMFFQHNSVNKGFKRESIEGYTRELWDTVQVDEQKKKIISGLEQFRKIAI